MTGRENINYNCYQQILFFYQDIKNTSIGLLGRTKKEIIFAPDLIRMAR
jgi:hypothetical protein